MTARSLPWLPAPAATPLSAISQNKRHPSSSWACRHFTDEAQAEKSFLRRTLALGLTGAVLGLSVGERSAMAAARRQPPPPPEQKSDPNLSGLQAKVLASKKRKEAMKEEMAKLRAEGKALEQPTPQ